LFYGSSVQHGSKGGAEAGAGGDEGGCTDNGEVVQCAASGRASIRIRVQGDGAAGRGFGKKGGPRRCTKGEGAEMWCSKKWHQEIMQQGADRRFRSAVGGKTEDMQKRIATGNVRSKQEGTRCSLKGAPQKRGCKNVVQRQGVLHERAQACGVS
jgi:hypothetical protein